MSIEKLPQWDDLAAKRLVAVVRENPEAQRITSAIWNHVLELFLLVRDHHDFGTEEGFEGIEQMLNRMAHSCVAFDNDRGEFKP